MHPVLLLCPLALSVVLLGAVSAQDHLHTIVGDSAADRLGVHVASAGDIDRDGYGDVLVGVSGDDDNGTDSGAALVLSGKTGSVVYKFKGSGPGDYFGRSGALVGDVNKDGYGDLAIGAYDRNTSRPGYVTLFSGKDGAVIRTMAAPAIDKFGVAVDGAGDVNGDGYPDIVVGAFQPGPPLMTGYAKVFSGKDGSVLWTLTGEAGGDYFGHSVAGLGDLDLDGHDDVGVGAPNGKRSGIWGGYVKIFSGKTGKVLFRVIGDSLHYYFGAALSSAGDVNKDGFPDVIVGAPGDGNLGTRVGYARVISGKDGGVLHTFNGDADRDHMGYFVDGGADLNGDSHPDLLVGAPQWSKAAPGFARAYSGKDGSVLFTVSGRSDGDQFGGSLAMLDDTSSDGLADVVVGAQGADDNGAESGSAVVLSGRSAVTPRWVRRRPTVAPAARSLAAMAYDSRRGRFVLFGGWTGCGSNQNQTLGDTWEWDGQRWQDVTPTSGSQPAPRGAAMMAYDVGRDRTVLFGGSVTGANCSSTARFFGDTWEWDGSVWTERKLSGSTPPPRNYGAMAYDPGRSRTVLFGGYDGSYRADTWEWDGVSWSQAATTGPGKRAITHLAYDTVRKRIVLYGGTPGSSAYGDMWEWNGSNWATVPTLGGPTPRGGHGLAYDSRRSKLLVYGGVRWPSTVHPGETWEWSGWGWNRVPAGPTPPARWGMAFGYDSRSGETLLFGGTDSMNSSSVFGETWELVHVPATYTTYGAGCSSRAVTPALRASTPPRIGFRFQLDVENIVSPTAGVLVFGNSDRSWNGVPLPLELTPIGMPGCYLLTSWLAEVAFVLRTGGTWSWTTVVPPNATLIGETFYNQAWVLDSTANSLGVSTSNGAKGVVGF